MIIPQSVALWIKSAMWSRNYITNNSEKRIIPDYMAFGRSEIGVRLET
jgi:hypothetical protein